MLAETHERFNIGDCPLLSGGRYSRVRARAGTLSSRRLVESAARQPPPHQVLVMINLLIN